MELIKDFKEVFIFLVILVLWLVIILIFRLDLIIGLQNIVTISAIIVALGTAVISTIYNKKSLKQSEINLNKLLLYEDRKKALLSVLQFLDTQYVDLEDLKSENFPEYFFLPDDTKKLITFHINKCEEKTSKLEIYTFEIANEAEKEIRDNVIYHLENL